MSIHYGARLDSERLHVLGKGILAEAKNRPLFAGHTGEYPCDCHRT